MHNVPMLINVVFHHQHRTSTSVYGLSAKVIRKLNAPHIVLQDTVYN